MSIGFIKPSCLLRLRKFAFHGSQFQNAGFAKRPERDIDSIQNQNKPRGREATTNFKVYQNDDKGSVKNAERNGTNSRRAPLKDDIGREGMQQTSFIQDHVKETECNDKIPAKSTKSTKSIRLVKAPNYPSVSQYSESIRDAFNRDDVEQGFQLIQEMTVLQRNPECIVFLSYWDYCRRDRMNLSSNVQRMLTFLGRNAMAISAIAVNELRKLLKSNRMFLNYAAVSENGKCSSCGDALNRVSLFPTEFENLKTAFKEKVMVANNNDFKTTSKEWSYFTTVVRRGAPFDIVIDGLNLAYAIKSSLSSAIMQAKTVESALKYFVDQQKRVLFVGRKHMELWPDTQRRFINQNSTVFLTKNLSSDDPYLLHAALLSGSKTKILSRDTMQDHACMLEPETAEIFRRWQQRNQYFFRPDEFGQVEILPQVNFNVFAHKNGRVWHVPYTAEYTRKKSDMFVRPMLWACIPL